ncbi:DnaJ domain-containing protein [Chelativorans sp. SCAU2101]|jgi:DnaJ-class molecular chaperone with C-terminal Zn finger domain|uniref:DnaJ domain-containing protein n=1 Tax=Chelativorans petroleitrophicus TaxID=2975484 RepID=A0A9X2X6E3_9HYPH|nr:DnaJ domain-containing protein [Chelativorans petroleitrophicus]MCT8989433.1 DnaJ domain-containing protein [Chelativorans petroleitrophicus]
MTYLIALLAILLLLALAAFAFTQASPARIASAVRLTGPALLGLAGVVLLLAGRAALGGVLLSGAAAWLSSGRFRSAPKPSPGQKSSVRSAALEMELDHDTGALSGVVLAGRYEGRALAGMSLKELLGLRRELAGDGESLQLLEAYLDSRFPLWRESTDAHENARERSAPRSGAMSKEEAYQVLGLEAGAAPAEIRKAHRRLMQRLHPDMGGSAFLAARINEARDVLLSDHR